MSNEITHIGDAVLSHNIYFRSFEVSTIPGRTNSADDGHSRRFIFGALPTTSYPLSDTMTAFEA